MNGKSHLKASCAKKSRAKGFQTQQTQQTQIESQTSNQLADDEFEYRVRESSRAKHVSIKVSVEGDVEIVVPQAFDCAQLPEILARRKAWILMTRSRLISEAKDTPQDWQVEKPESILFRWQSSDLDEASISATTDQWMVRYQPTQSSKITCIPSFKKLTLEGNTDSTPLCQSVLRKWLTHRAHRSLAPWLRQLGYELDLPCRSISVRGQKTRALRGLPPTRKKKKKTGALFQEKEQAAFVSFP